jgi:hypothetical protein
MIVFLFSCLTWAQENDAARTASRQAQEISRGASARANEISRGASARANTAQYSPSYYGGGGYGWGYQPQPVYQIRQEGSVAIAQSARVTVDPVDCLERAVKALGSPDKGAAYCKSIFDREAKRSEKVSNEASDGAQKMPRPVFMLPRYW